MALEDELAGGVVEDPNVHNFGNVADPLPTRRLTITVPQSGPPGRLARDLGVKGKVLATLLVADGPIELCQESCQLVDRSVRIRIWLDGRDITPAPLLSEDDLPGEAAVSAPQVSSPVPMHDPELRQLQVALDEKRRLLQDTNAQVAAAQALLGLVHDEVRAARARRDEEYQAAGQVAKRGMENLNDFMARERQLRANELDHTLGQFKKLNNADEESLEKLRDVMRSTSETLGLGVELRRHLREIGRPSTVRESLQTVRDLGQMVIDGPLGTLATGFIQTTLSKSQGRPVAMEEVLEAHLLAGRRAHERNVQLRTLLATQVPTVAVHSAALTADFLAGQLPLEAFVHFLKANQPRATVSQVG